MVASRDLVVLGLGYVGLPVAVEAALAGLEVVGVDVDAARVDVLAGGGSMVGDVSDAQLGKALKGSLRVTSDVTAVADADAVVVCVPTPLDADGTPDLSAVRAAMRDVATHLHPGALVVLESTTYPGTTQDVVVPLLEAACGLTAGVDFHVAFSPERIDPGNANFGLRNTPKIVGGLTPACTQAAAALYRRVCERVVTVSGTREAEMAKLLENTYRHINIALVNEMAVFCDELGIDLWESIAAAATKPFGFQAFYPGPGVGGHCIPIDPNYLSWKVRSLGYPFRFVELAQEVNSRMPSYIASRVQRALNDRRLAVNGSRLLLLGVTYKANVADERESPALPLARQLIALGATINFHDPYVGRWAVDGDDIPRVDDPVAAAIDADLTILLQAHDPYDLDLIATHARALFDTRGRAHGDHVERL